ncbi:hypothetical protein NXS19_012733 [Fusarium pseudograminearum]|nr:hypothetical protein NXS19_012733 [Fusarium pseudograminearum]
MTSQRSNVARTPAKSTKAAAPTSSAKQRSIVSFFSKAPPSSPAAASSPLAKPSPTPKQSSCLKETTKANSLPKTTPLSKSKSTPTTAAKQTTPVPDSDAIDPQALRRILIQPSR